MSSSSDIDAGRAAVADRRWADALELLARVDARDGLEAGDLDLLAVAAMLRGDSAASVAARSRAYSAHLLRGDDVGAARSAEWLALDLIELGDFTNSVMWSARAMRVASAVPQPGSLAGFVRMAPGVAQFGAGDAAEAVPRFEEIVAIADRERDRELAAVARLGLGKSLLEAGRVIDGLACLDLAVAAVVAGDVAPVPSGVICCASISDAIMAFDLQRAGAWTAALDRWCVEQPQLIAFSGQCRALKAALLLIHGHWDEASAAAEFAMARLRAGDYRAIWGAPYRSGELARLRGAFHAAEEYYRRAGESGWDPEPGLSLLHLAAGRTQRAHDGIRRSAAGSDPFTRLSLLPAVAEIDLAAGDVAGARRAVDELREATRVGETPMLEAFVAATESAVLLAEGLLAEAATQARSAIRAWDAVDSPYEAARSRVILGRALRATGDEAAAQAEFDAARGVFLALRAEPAADGLAREAGDRRPGTLTSRELEVLRLVSTGLTNRGVGEKLSLSEKTVARHLANIFGKLGLPNRAAATAYAYEHGLV
ncbi:LuxR C-terminal-related transcriptional regulator [Microbacterium sp. NPDC058389]|uniref:LuxR C-terminal-related transcriptional regulator n=1 Tax=Microbacterium sp. NPDC058389 TaxID=3346475 RepID=UPI0036496EFB